jgi:ABC-type proline/glycine betaine transport system ATPase subunit
MVTHDVDEALFLSDRVVCMTDGPEATVGDVLPVTFSRPRERKAVMAHPDYYSLREHLIDFLETRAHKKDRPVVSAAPATVPVRAAKSEVADPRAPTQSTHLTIRA